MRFIQFAYKKNFGYSENKISDFGFQMLGMFLTGEVGNNATTYTNWALNPTKKANSGNLVWIKKSDENIILLFDPVMDMAEEALLDWILKNDPLDAEETFIMKIDEFVHVIHYWVEAPKKYFFKEIWIKCEDGVFWIEGVDPIRR